MKINLSIRVCFIRCSKRDICVLVSHPSICPFFDQILEALACNDDMLVQMCAKLSSSCDEIPQELQGRFSAMCGERVEHINRRITNYRKVTILSCYEDKHGGILSISSLDGASL